MNSMMKGPKCLDGKVFPKKNISAILISMKTLLLLQIIKKIKIRYHKKFKTKIWYNLILSIKKNKNKKKNKPIKNKEFQ